MVSRVTGFGRAAIDGAALPQAWRSVSNGTGAELAEILQSSLLSTIDNRLKQAYVVTISGTMACRPIEQDRPRPQPPAPGDLMEVRLGQVERRLRHLMYSATRKALPLHRLSHRQFSGTRPYAGDGVLGVEAAMPTTHDMETRGPGFCTVPLAINPTLSALALAAAFLGLIASR